MKNRGSILVITIWILMLLSLLALGLSYRMGIELKLVGYNTDHLKAFYTAKAGVLRTILELQNDFTKEYDGYKENWGNNREAFKNYKLGEGRFTIKSTYVTEENDFLLGAVDEQSKINLNKASVKVLEALLELIEEDKEIATNILDWIDKDSKAGNQGEGFGAEDGFYEGLGKRYPCKNKPIEILEELLMIKDISQDIYTRIKNYLTIYGDGLININTASGLVLKALGLEESLTEKIIEYRAGEDNLEGTPDDQLFTDLYKMIKILDEEVGLDSKEVVSLNNLLAKKPSLLSLKSDYFRIISEGKVGKIKKNIEVVIKRDKQQYPEILFWKEQ
ncbi:general secretion pathway protein GspK [Candidatus Auribacterota bacterium]